MPDEFTTASPMVTLSFRSASPASSGASGFPALCPDLDVALIAERRHGFAQLALCLICEGAYEFDEYVSACPCGQPGRGAALPSERGQQRRPSPGLRALVQLLPQLDRGLDAWWS